VWWTNRDVDLVLEERHVSCVHSICRYKDEMEWKEVGEEIAQGNGCEVVMVGKSERGRGQRTCVIPVHGPLGNAPGSKDMEQGRPVVVSICC
jgi:hypothetical protein